MKNLGQEEKNEFCVSCKEDGGLELMLPGNYYQTMKNAQEKNLMSPADYDNLSFETLK
jgi:hypothetical protein